MSLNYLVCWFILIQSRSSSKVKIIGHGHRRNQVQLLGWPTVAKEKTWIWATWNNSGLSAVFGEIEYFIPIDAEFYEESYYLSGITPLDTSTQ